MSGSPIGRLVGLSVAALTAWGCGSAHHSSPGTAGSANGGAAGQATSSVADSGSAGTANMLPTPASSGGAAGDTGGGVSGAASEGGERGEGGQALGGAAGSEELPTSSEVAKSCHTPMSTLLTVDNSFGWKTAALRIDPGPPTCELQAGVGVGSGGNALYFAHETNDTYSLWSDQPWSFELEAGQSANDLPQQQQLTVFPFQEGLRLAVVFSVSNDSVTVSSVTPQ